MKKIAPFLVALAVLAGCGEKKSRAPVEKPAAEGRSDATPELGSFGVDLAAIDVSVDPGDDFYAYVNGNWLKSFEIPDAYASYSALSALAERSDARLAAIVASLRSNATEGTIERKIADFRAAYLDVAAIEARGLSPIAQDFAAIDGFAAPDAVGALFFNPAFGGPIAAEVGVDARRPDRRALHLTQGELGLGARAHYVDERFAGLRDRYRDYVAAMIRLAGGQDPAGAAQRIVDLETELARIQWDAEKRRSRDLTYNRTSLEQIETLAPAIPWRTVLPAATKHGVILREDDVVRKAIDILVATPVATLRDYLKFRLLDANADVLPRAFDASRRTFLKDAFGAADTDRASRALDAIERDFGDGLARLYAARHFHAETRAEAAKIASNLRAELDQSLVRLSWMSDETKISAREKLETFSIKLGAPERWRDYGALVIRPDDAYGNAARLREFERAFEMSRLDRPVDRTEWEIRPQSAAVFYNPFLNDVVAPAAILEAPLFDPDADDAVNYGAIGALLGHEMSHAVDGRGRKTDGHGVVADWWTAEDERLYAERAAALAAQYAGAIADDDPALAEAMSDIGGLALAFRAWRRSLGGTGAPVIDGFTGEQRFFLGYAQMMRRAVRQDAIHRQRDDAHVSAQLRVNGAVRNLDAWREAFGVRPGDALWLDPDDRIEIW